MSYDLNKIKFHAKCLKVNRAKISVNKIQYAAVIVINHNKVLLQN